MNIEIYENNAGGLTLVAKENDNLEVVHGLEYTEKAGTGIDDIISYGNIWDWRDASDGWTGKQANIDQEFGILVAELEKSDSGSDLENELRLYPWAMGTAARRFFGIDEEIL